VQRILVNQIILGRKVASADFFTYAIDKSALRPNRHNVGVLQQKIQLFFQSIWARNIIGIHKSDKIAFGQLYHPVERNGKTVALNIFVNFESFVLFFEGVEDGGGFVGRKIVNGNNFNLLI
jgi:hypothetical protein